MAPYVSARYAPPDPFDPAPDKSVKQRVIATDENGIEWWLTTDSQVGDWLRFIEAGGEILEVQEEV